MEEIEELINDPGNHALLKEAAGEEEVELGELAQQAGLTEERTKDKLEQLTQRELVDLKKSEMPTALELQRENLQELSNQIKSFHQDRRQVLKKNLEEEEKLLKDAKHQLDRKKEETDVVKKEKKFERRKERIQNTLKLIQEAETDEELLEAHSYSHRILKITGKREKDFHGFNPYRKLKASMKIKEILEIEPEKDDEPRRFFGNRWVKKSRL